MNLIYHFVYNVQVLNLCVVFNGKKSYKLYYLIKIRYRITVMNNFCALGDFKRTVNVY